MLRFITVLLRRMFRLQFVVLFSACSVDPGATGGRDKDDTPPEAPSLCEPSDVPLVVSDLRLEGDCITGVINESGYPENVTVAPDGTAVSVLFASDMIVNSQVNVIGERSCTVAYNLTIPDTRFVELVEGAVEFAGYTTGTANSSVNQKLFVDHVDVDTEQTSLPHLERLDEPLDGGTADANDDSQDPLQQRVEHRPTAEQRTCRQSATIAIKQELQLQASVTDEDWDNNFLASLHTLDFVVSHCPCE